MKTSLVMGCKHIGKRNQRHSEQRADRVAGAMAVERAIGRSLGIAREMVKLQPNEDPWNWGNRSRVALGSGQSSDNEKTC